MGKANNQMTNMQHVTPDNHSDMKNIDFHPNQLAQYMQM